MSATDFAWEEWRAIHPTLAIPAEEAYEMGVEWGSQRTWRSAELIAGEVADEILAIAEASGDVRARFAINLFASLFAKAIGEVGHDDE